MKKSREFPLFAKNEKTILQMLKHEYISLSHNLMYGENEHELKHRCSFKINKKRGRFHDTKPE